MRHGRAKAARKTLQHFGRTIGLKAPYWILMDGTFVAALFQHKILPVRERLDRVLQTSGAAGQNKYCITQSAVEELGMIQEGLEAKKSAKAFMFQQALEWIQKECIVLNKKKEEDGDEDENSEKRSSSALAQNDLLFQIDSNEKPYIVASQDEILLGNLRPMGKIPIVRLANNSVLLLEQPSKQSQLQFKGMERQKWRHRLPESERALVDLVKEEHKMAKKSSEYSQPSRQRGKSKAKGPNPLSCKRKNRAEGTKESASKKRRNRAKKQKTES